MKYEMNIYIDNKLKNIKFPSENKLGGGQYGNVFLFKDSDKKYAIKISERDDFRFENHVYIKYHKFNEDNYIALPKSYGYGKALNKFDGVRYYYIIIGYVGIITLQKFITIIRENNLYTDEIKYILRMIYKIIILYLSSLHKCDLICRDIKPENIVINDNILSYIICQFGIDKIKKFVPYYFYNNYLKDVSYKNIENFYNEKQYHNIVQIIDTGLFCDISFLDINYSKNNEKCYSDFPDFYPYDTIFSTTITYLSPFAIFNLSDKLQSSIKNKSKETIILLLKYLLKISDFWSFNVVYACSLYDLLKNYTNDSLNIKSNLQKLHQYKNTYTYHYTQHIFFDVLITDKKINFILKHEIMSHLFDHDIGLIEIIVMFFSKILEIANNIANKVEKSHLPLKVNFDDEKFTEIFGFILAKINELNNGFKKFYGDSIDIIFIED
jgi:serine/threonine protein kinase